MIKALKKNQIIIFAIALMLITAGYLSYTMNTEQTAETSALAEQEEYAAIGDARLVNSGNAVNSTNINQESSDVNLTNSNSQNTNNDSKNNNEEVNETSATDNSINKEKESDAYFAESRLERDKMYSEMLETYQSMFANTGASAEQKSSAQTEISNINKQKNAIMIAENLIKNKGFKDIVIFVNNDSVSAVIRAEKLETAEIAQVQSIIQRELGVKVENIHISNKK